jgi:hypothetical protein
MHVKTFEGKEVGLGSWWWVRGWWLTAANGDTDRIKLPERAAHFEAALFSSLYGVYNPIAITFVIYKGNVK